MCLAYVSGPDTLRPVSKASTISRTDFCNSGGSRSYDLISLCSSSPSNGTGLPYDTGPSPSSSRMLILNAEAKSWSRRPATRFSPLSYFWSCWYETSKPLATCCRVRPRLSRRALIRFPIWTSASVVRLIPTKDFSLRSVSGLKSSYCMKSMRPNRGLVEL